MSNGSGSEFQNSGMGDGRAIVRRLKPLGTSVTPAQQNENMQESNPPSTYE